MNGIKLARIRRCARCEFNRNTGAWPWPKCCFSDRTGETGAPLRDDAFMEGPDENCPAGRWAGLEPVDMEAVAREQKRRKLQGQRERLKPLVLERLRGRSQEHVDDVLETLSALGALEPEIAVEISDELEGQTP